MELTQSRKGTLNIMGEKKRATSYLILLLAVPFVIIVPPSGRYTKHAEIRQKWVKQFIEFL